MKLFISEFLAIDPVCGMHVNEKRAVYKKTVDDKTLYFCSMNCMKIYEKPEVEIKKLKVNVLIAVLITFSTIAISFFTNIPFKNFVLLIFASLIQFYPGRRFYFGTWDAFKARTLNMD